MSAVQQALLAYGARPSTAPNTVSGLTMWIDASQPSTLFINSGDGSPVSADGDQVGIAASSASIARCLGQSSAGARPLYKTGIQNGKSVLRFDGSNDVMLLYALTGSSTQGASLAGSAIANASAFTAIVALQIIGADTDTGTSYTNDCVLSLIGSFNFTGLYVKNLDAGNVTLVGVHHQAAPDAHHTVTQSLAKSTWAVVTIKQDSGTFYLRVNGGAWQSVTSGDSGTYTSQSRFGSPPNAAKFLEHDMGQMAIYDTAVADGDITLVENYIANALGIAY